MTRKFKLVQTEARLLAALAAPIFMAQLAHQTLAFVDTLMAGRVSAEDLAGVAVGGSLWIPTFLFIHGVLLSLTPMVAQLAGAGRTDETGPLVRRGLLVAIPLALIGILLLRHAGWVFTRMEVAPQVASIAIGYLKGISWGVPGLALFLLLRNLSEGLGQTRPSMVIGLAGIPVNAASNYLLIYGKMGLPALGGAGCGWASALTLWFMAGCMVLTIWRFRRYRSTRFFDPARRHGGEGALHILRLGLPIGFSLLVEASAFALIALFLSPLGGHVVAAHQITLNYSSLIFILPLSIAIAITIRVGHAVGKKRYDRARLVSATGLLVNIFIAVATVALTLILARQIAGIYTHDAEVIAIATGLLYLNAFFQLPDAFQVGTAAALRGYKDTRIPLGLIVIAYWVIGLPLGYTLAMTGFWGPPLGARGFWISLIVGLCVAAVLLGGRLYRVSRREA
ncbi:MAG: MATE family efflux transporter [Deltaproteobacteria bacterium]|nr:MATE family efflux transporter [Deltaproteobacteria bacterium]